jgi:hypothetical protein
VGTFGNIHSLSSSTLTNNVGNALATSVVQNVDFAKVIKIKQVTSTATATTDGAKADATGATVVQGLEIAGQQAYVDETGVHSGKQGAPANATADSIVTQALGKAGVSTYTSRPQKTVDGASAQYTAGSFIFVWFPPNNDSKNIFIMTLGGARVAVAAAPGTDYSATPDTGGPADTTAPADVAGSTATAPASAELPATGDLGSPSTSATAGAGGRPGTTLNTGTGTLAASFGGIGAGWILVGLAAAALVGLGSRRLRDDLLDRGTAATCPLETRR